MRALCRPRRRTPPGTACPSARARRASRRSRTGSAWCGRAPPPPGPPPAVAKSRTVRWNGGGRRGGRSAWPGTVVTSDRASPPARAADPRRAGPRWLRGLGRAHPVRAAPAAVSAEGRRARHLAGAEGHSRGSRRPRRRAPGGHRRRSAQRARRRRDRAAARRRPGRRADRRGAPPCGAARHRAPHPARAARWSVPRAAGERGRARRDRPGHGPRDAAGGRRQPARRHLAGRQGLRRRRVRFDAERRGPGRARALGRRSTPSPAGSRRSEASSR